MFLLFLVSFYCPFCEVSLKYMEGIALMVVVIYLRAEYGAWYKDLITWVQFNIHV